MVSDPNLLFNAGVGGGLLFYKEIKQRDLIRLWNL
jgi:hypothetical protein